MTNQPMKAECPVCGPLPDDHVHSICHRIPVWGVAIPTHRLLKHRSGCGHALKDHNPSLKCRVCKEQCGVDCTPVGTPYRPWGVPESVWQAWGAPLRVA